MAWRGLADSLGSCTGGADKLENEQYDHQEAVDGALSSLENALSVLRAELAQIQLKKAVQLREDNRFGAALLALDQALAYQPGNGRAGKESQTHPGS